MSRLQFQSTRVPAFTRSCEGSILPSGASSFALRCGYYLPLVALFHPTEVATENQGRASVQPSGGGVCRWGGRRKGREGKRGKAEQILGGGRWMIYV